MSRVRLGYALMGAGMLAALAAAVMMIGRHFVALGIAFGVAVLLILAGAALVALTGTPEERGRRQAQVDRRAAAMGEALGRASGGWTPRRRQPPE